MTTGAAWALAFAAAAAVADWVARARDSKRVEYVAKPAATVGLLAAAALLDPADPGRRWWFVAALAWSLAGDVFLMLPSDRFVAGLASFLVGHLCYVAGFWTDPPGGGALAASAAVVVVAVAPVAARVRRGIRTGGHPGLEGPVLAYVAVISAMVASALASGNAWAAGGAAVFAASDSLIAWDRFVRRLAWAPVAIMVTYHLGQAGLVLSLP